MDHAPYVLTPWSAQRGVAAPSIERGEGVYLYDDAGNRYLDLASGLVAANLGHGHAQVVRAIADQAGRLCFAPPSLRNSQREAYAAELSAISPWPEGCRTFFTTGGGEANEDAMKMARMITGRHKVFSAYRSFHGSAPGAGTLSGENRRWPNEPGIPGVARFFTPYPYRSPFHTMDPQVETERALAHLELVLTYENPASVAAVFIEPVVGSNGAIVYPDGYLEGVRDVCDRHGILLVFDEVMTGFGRVGERFAAVRFGVTPDIMTIAKGSTSAYVPLGGVMLRESLAAHFDDNVLGCGHTYSGHPLAMAAGRGALEAYRDGALFTRARTIEHWLREDLGRLAERIPIVGEVRGIGAFFAVELVADRATREPLVAWQGPTAGILPKLLGRLRELGVYTFGRYNVVIVTPPLIISRDELAEGIAAFETALEELAAIPA
ncbi:MAG: aminotransferase class III-fold pyridoxal phosphate-dependent enzyme [Candidatus Eremiobacteraeota bacterium]|nr:aminotransferase class III-fold pyridoxal phosphate-dependent enzyme [Candidatus Eremiobacteraeota bacterium]